MSDYIWYYSLILGNLGKYQEEIDVLKAQIGSQYDNEYLRECIIQNQFFLYQFEQVLQCISCTI